jgi:uncharacterized protein YbjT (DUF2867 family)
MTTNQLILVTGGTGKTGRRTAQRLAERGVPVRIGREPREFADYARAAAASGACSRAGAVSGR